SSCSDATPRPACTPTRFERMTASRPRSATRWRFSPLRTCSATRPPSRPCSSRSRAATSTSRICPSPTPCSFCRRSQSGAAWPRSWTRTCFLRRLRRRVQDRRDDERLRVVLFGVAGLLDELRDQLERALRADPRRHLSRAERALRAVLAPAALHLVEHRRAQVGGQPR